MFIPNSEYFEMLIITFCQIMEYHDFRLIFILIINVKLLHKFHLNVTGSDYLDNPLKV